MSLTTNRWFRRFGIGAIAAVALGVTAIGSAPAQAQNYGYYQRAPIVHHAAFFPRIFFGYGGYHWHHWDHHWR